MLFHLQPAGGALAFSSDVFIMDAVGGGDMNLGELADLTVANDNELSIDVNKRLTWPTLTAACEWAHNPAIMHVSVFILCHQMQDNREEFKKTWNPRFTLRSHFDAIRALTFHPSQAVLLTASEDGTLKLWNLNKAMHSKK